jgi:SHS2 domain-containing protein
VNGFEFIDHTADVGVVAHGDTLAEVFVQAALGMVSFMSDLDAIEEREIREVEVTASDQEALLVAWLNELVYLLGVEDLLFRRFEVLEVDDTHLQARCHGERLDHARHRITTEVKSATYHMLEVKKNDSWHARVILDI